jgi:hypothetical protein
MLPPFMWHRDLLLFTKSNSLSVVFQTGNDLELESLKLKAFTISSHYLWGTTSFVKRHRTGAIVAGRLSEQEALELGTEANILRGTHRANTTEERASCLPSAG